MIEQSIIDRAVKIATRRALSGNPVRKITWVPPKTASSDPGGVFAIEVCEPRSACETPPWETKN